MKNAQAPYEVFSGVVEIPGVGVGSVTDVSKRTGVTVVLLPEGACGAVDVAGGAPATRETPVLDPSNTIQGPDAVVLSGGSAVGLRTADGVIEGLQELGRGVAVGTIHIPIVVAAAIFDMDEGKAQAPTVDDGMAALREAATGIHTIREGRQGAGTGATVGKGLGLAARMAGGQGAVTLRTADGLLVSAIMVVNAVGSVLDESGLVLAGPQVGGVAQNTTDLWAGIAARLGPGGATTIGTVLTNAQLSKAELQRVARMSHDGLARAIEPVHTPWDGDTIFALSVGSQPDDVSRVGALAARAVAMAVRRAVQLANA